MILENLREINPLGGINAFNTKSGAEIYLKPGTLLHDLALEGTFGEVARYVPPPRPEEKPTYPDAAAAVAAMVGWVEAFVAPLTAGTPIEERLSWPSKEIAARAVLAGNPSEHDLLLIETEAAVLGETPEGLSTLILERATLFRKVSAKIAGLRRKVTAALQAEADPFRFDAILDAAKVEARTFATELGLAEALGLEV